MTSPPRGSSVEALGLPAEVSAVVPSSEAPWEEASSRREKRSARRSQASVAEEAAETDEVREVRPEEDLEAALRASSEEHEQAIRDEAERLERALELSRECEAERRRDLDLRAQTDEEALALALELSRRSDPAEVERRELEAALESSRRETGRVDAKLDDDALLLEAALRRSLDDGGAPPPGLASHAPRHRPAPRLLTPRHIVDDDRSQLELALHLSEQVESLERVLDEEEDAETLRFALAASEADDSSR